MEWQIEKKERLLEVLEGAMKGRREMRFRAAGDRIGGSSLIKHGHVNS